MSYELKAILEYDAARISIINAKEDIGIAIAAECKNTEVISALESSSCIDRLYAHNTYVKCYSENEGEIDYGYHVEYMAKPGETPTLCERCKALDEKIQLRKLCKKRFGIAKVRLSRIARDHRNSTAIHVDEI